MVFNDLLWNYNLKKVKKFLLFYFNLIIRVNPSVTIVLNINPRDTFVFNINPRDTRDKIIKVSFCYHKSNI